MSTLLVILLIIQASIYLSDAFICSDLDLSASNKNTDQNYAIFIDKIPSSNVVQVSLTKSSDVSDTSWFLLGATDTSRLVGSWQPFASGDGEVVSCSGMPEQAVTNQARASQSVDQTEFTFYWMPPSGWSTPIVFVATLYYTDSIGETTALRFLQSPPVEFERSSDRDRFQDVSPSESISITDHRSCNRLTLQPFATPRRVSMPAHAFVIPNSHTAAV